MSQPQEETILSSIEEVFDEIGFDMELPDKKEDFLKAMMEGFIDDEIMTEKNLGKDYQKWRDNKDLIPNIFGLMKEGYALKDILKVDDGNIEKMYDYGYQMYNNGKYKEALSIFQKIVTFDPSNDKFVMAVASCFQMLKEYPAATDCYMAAAHIDVKNPYPHYYSAECYLKMGDRTSAILSLNLAVNIAKGQKKHKALREHCIILKSKLLAQSKKKKKKKKHKEGGKDGQV